MRLYWNIESIPELSSFPREERRRIWRQNFRHVLKRWLTWVYVLVACICSLLVVGPFVAISYTIWGTSDPAGSMLLGIFMGSVPGGGIAGLVFGVLVTNIMRAELRSRYGSHTG